MTDHRHDPETMPIKGRIVYIRKLAEDETPEGAPKDVLYAIHDSAGQRLGIAPDRESAFSAARMHELTPVSVH